MKKALQYGFHYDEGNLGHRPRVKGGYFPDSPIDTGTNLRAEMLSVIASMGVEVENITMKWRQANMSWASNLIHF